MTETKKCWGIRSWSNDLYEYEYSKKTEKSVWLVNRGRERRTAITSQGYDYYFTEAEAIIAIRAKVQSRVQLTRQALYHAEEELQRVFTKYPESVIGE